MPDARKVALFIAVFAGFLTPFDLSAVNIALPAIGAEFSLDAVTMGWIATAYLLSSAVFLLPIGRLADIHGRKRVFATGLVIFTTASFLLIFSTSAVMLIALRIVQGAGASLIFGTAVAILTSVTPPSGRGQALGIYTTAVYLGLSCGPFFGGWLTHMFGWRSIFLINLPIGIITLALIFLYLDGEWADARGEPFDLGGSVQYSLTLICLMLGFTLLPGTDGCILIGAGALMALVFISRERRIQYPLLDLSLWAGNRVFAFSNLAAFINYSATFSVTFFMSLYLQYVRGFDPWTAGAILVVQPVAQAALSPLAGRLSDRIAPGTIASFGMGLCAAGLAALFFVGATTPIPVIVLILVVIGMGLGIFSSPNTNAIMGSVEKRMYGIASGTLSTMRLFGQMISMGIATMIIALIIGRVPITAARHDQLVTSMHIAFAFFAAMCVAGIFLSLVRCRELDMPGACGR